MLSEATLQKKYKISQAEWQAMYDKQNGRCAICNCQQRYQSLAVDHCHKTGKVRGLLCVQCNRGLGRFFDSPIRLRRAAEYIEKSRLPVDQIPPLGAIALSPALSPPALIDEVNV